MKKAISLIFALAIVFALLFMGVMEKTLGGIGGNKAIIIFYVILAVILLILYLRARRQAAEEAEENPEQFETPEEISEEQYPDDEVDYCDEPYIDDESKN